MLFPVDFTGVMTLTSSAQNEVTGKTLTVVDVSVSDKWHTFCADCEVVNSVNLYRSFQMGVGG